MKTQAIFSIDLQTLIRLNELSKKSETSKSSIVRAALKAHLDGIEQASKKADSLFQAVGV